MIYKKFHQKHPSELIVQDIANVIRQFPTEPGKVQFHGPRLFTKQPIEDLNEFLILSATTNSIQMQRRTTFIQFHKIGLMQNRGISYDTFQTQWLPGIAKLLINENIIPEQKADWQITRLDLVLMTLASTQER